MIMFTEAERHLVQLALERAAQSEEAKADMIKPASATREIRRQVKAWRRIAKAMDPKPIKPARGYARRVAKYKAEQERQCDCCGNMSRDTAKTIAYGIDTVACEACRL